MFTAILLTIVLSLGVVYVIFNEPLPKGIEGVEAERLADKMLDAINHIDWEKTGAIEWDFGGRQKHIWDKKMHLVQVSWSEYVVQIDIGRRKGVVLNALASDDPKELSKICLKAWKFWANDSFWLNPISKIRDYGTSRSIVSYEGQSALLITYNNGGVTPGDSYLWLVNDDGLPYEWKMWVGIIPIGGISTSWEEWKTLGTGAKISSVHKNGLTLQLSDIKAANSIRVLKGSDIFHRLNSNESLIVNF